MTSRSLHFLDDDTFIALEELAGASGLDQDEILELVDYGVFEPRRRAGTWLFSARSIVYARRAARLRRDFELSSDGLALALTYLDRIEELEQQLHTLQCQMLGD